MMITRQYWKNQSISFKIYYKYNLFNFTCKAFFRIIHVRIGWRDGTVPLTAEYRLIYLQIRHLQRHKGRTETGNGHE
jgi:hypothetical protein